MFASVLANYLGDEEELWCMVKTIEIINATNEQLIKISEEGLLSLNLEEMKAHIKSFCVPELTDLGMVISLWEHYRLAAS